MINGYTTVQEIFEKWGATLRIASQQIIGLLLVNIEIGGSFLQKT